MFGHVAVTIAARVRESLRRRRVGYVARGRSQPDVDPARAERGVHDAGDVAAERGEVDLVAEAFGEGRGRSLGVVTGAVESAVDHRLDAPAKRLEQGGGEER